MKREHFIVVKKDRSCNYASQISYQCMCKTSTASSSLYSTVITILGIPMKLKERIHFFSSLLILLFDCFSGVRKPAIPDG
ncbi:hypothetical protein HanIR_Chr17g0865281 [Helianthus annuus]|nr:hypothetical protein HanIR_Chr17g0865281 [Helianthus annuus]